MMLQEDDGDGDEDTGRMMLRSESRRRKAEAINRARRAANSRGGESDFDTERIFFR